MARLLSVNVGLPRDIVWKGRTVHTGIWKEPVRGRCQAHRLGLDGDGQGDLAGHGGEQRAVYVYQIESFRYWQDLLKRTDFVCGQFGENFTVEGLADEAVCVGDRYQIGNALFEVTQPRVTCYRLSIRMNDSQMPALMTGHGRPGFYFRVLKEGDVGAGDTIVKVGEAKERMSVAEINALLYLPNHSPERLERALRIAALSPGWRSSFIALLQQSRMDGNAGLLPEAASYPTTPGFRSLEVTSIDHESADVISLTMQSSTRQPLPSAMPGQYVVLRLYPIAGGSPIFRSYSLSGPPSTERYRISVKVEPNGVAGTYLSKHLCMHDTLAVSAPRGSFILRAGERPVVLLSAGIGATPVLAMLYALSTSGSRRQILWVQAAQNREHHPFAAEVAQLMLSLAAGRSFVCYSRPGAEDKLGRDYDAAGHLSRSILSGIDLPQQADVYICGPNGFMTNMEQTLATLGVPPQQIHFETFNGGESLTPGIIGTSTPSPHVPAGDSSTGPLISFARSGIAAHWNAAAYQSILELAEACNVPVRWSCRTGVCHSCESGLVSGAITYRPAPLDYPAAGNVLICCTQPSGEVIVDL